MIKVDYSTPEGKAAYEAKGADELFKLWKEENNLGAGLFLGHAYHFGDEENGVFRNPEKAKEIYKEIGEPEEKSPYLGDDCPEIGKYTINGFASQINKVETLFHKLSEKYGMPDNELGLHLPLEVVMKVLVDSKYYVGNVQSLEKKDPNTLIIIADLDRPHVLLYALKEYFPDLDIKMEIEPI